MKRQIQQTAKAEKTNWTMTCSLHDYHSRGGIEFVRN